MEGSEEWRYPRTSVVFRWGKGRAITPEGNIHGYSVLLYQNCFCTIPNFTSSSITVKYFSKLTFLFHTRSEWTILPELSFSVTQSLICFASSVFNSLCKREDILYVGVRKDKSHKGSICVCICVCIWKHSLTYLSYRNCSKPDASGWCLSVSPIRHVL